MTTRTSVVAPTVPIRTQTIQRLTREFGAPESGKNYERWVFTPPAPRHRVHVMVNGPEIADRAHVLVFDPGASDGGNILEMDLRAIDELSWLVEHIKHCVAPRRKHVGRSDLTHLSDEISLQVSITTPKWAAQ